MQALRVAILWHHHQPSYRVNDEFVLPWVRLHAVKDYYDLAALQLEFPKLAMTYNIVPSLLMQLDDYLHDILDSVQRLSLVKAAELSDENKTEILASFFRCNRETMIKPYARFAELEALSMTENAMHRFELRDWLDLQVWYNLCWIGPVSRLQPSIHCLFEKGRDFSEEDKMTVLMHHRMIMKNIIPLHQELSASHRAELSVSPLYHPILPLLLNTDAAKEALPDISLPPHQFAFRPDAEWQVARAQQVFEENLNTSAKGMWCSEGSVSDETLSLLADYNLSWTATDEDVLRNTKGTAYRSTDIYFPHTFAKERRKGITVFFRDHHLSDAIGFVYQRWNAHDAAGDFINRLKQIRQQIINERGDQSLQDAVVSVILDGENCWEYYDDNGVHFIRALYHALSEDPELKTIRFQDACMNEQHPQDHHLDHITAGSWIHGNFAIWIGHEEKNEAWEQLFLARALVNGKRVTRKQWQAAMEHLYVAEGSDWFWWYGDDHQASTRTVFDEIFRHHLRKVYELYHEEIPAVLRRPIMKSGALHETFSTMHRVSEN